jgi:ribonuclease PH
VLQADGGTRTAAISGALRRFAHGDGDPEAESAGCDARDPVHGQVAAVSVGIYRRYTRSSTSTTPKTQLAETDMNIVMNDAGAFIEVQGTAEGPCFPTR